MTRRPALRTGVGAGLRAGLRIGFEVELVAPPGSSRRDLAEELAARCGGRVRPVWHADSEPSLVPGLGRFLHLGRGFAVHRPDGALLATLVDDVTLVEDLDRTAAPAPGWYRLLTDDPRLVRLLAEQADAAAPLQEVLEPIAALWGVRVQRLGAAYRVDDAAGATIALAAGQGGQRERPCEIVTPPLDHDHGAALAELLEPARSLGFQVPVEGAVHLHLDGGLYRPAPVLANLVRLFGHWREPLHRLLGTNPRCRRLGPIPPDLVAVADSSPTRDMLRCSASHTGLTKFHDVNLTQLLSDRPIRDTLEVRILPSTLDVAELIRLTRLITALLDRCQSHDVFPTPPTDPADALDELATLAVEHASLR